MTPPRHPAGATAGGQRRAADRPLPGARPPRASALSACLTYGWRGMLKIKHVPEQLIDVTLTPVLFLLMFTYLFGGALAGSTSDYLESLLPGILVQIGALHLGLLGGGPEHGRDQGRGRPIPLAAGVEAGAAGRRRARRQRALAVGAVVVVLLGLVLGFRPAAGVLGVVAAIALVIVFASGLAWVFTTVGMVLRTPSAVMNSGFMGLFPLIFLSNIFVDPATLPAALEAFVAVNPVSLLVTAVRGLMAGTATLGQIGLVLASSVVLTMVFAPLTVWLYRRKV